MKRIMYIECKGGALEGPGRIGWVELSRSKRSYRYAGMEFRKAGSGYKYNCIDSEPGARYWISGPKKDGTDRLYGGVVEIDEAARMEYWTKIRSAPQCAHLSSYRS